MDRVRPSGLLRGGGSDSGVSDISALENETDDFGRRILQHQKDQLRLKNAAQGAVPFRKARPAPRTESIKHQRSQSYREDLLAEQGHDRAGSVGSNDSDPPLNIPPGWGRRKKQLGDWPREIETVEENGGTRTPRRDDDAIILRKTSYTGDDSPKFKRYASNDGILPLVETTPPSMERRRRADLTPSSMHHMNTTIHHDLDASDDEEEDHDFTAESLLASTPAVNNRNRRIDALTGREIAALERKGITKRELEKIASNHDDSRPSSAPSGDLASKLQQTAGAKADKENLRPNGHVSDRANKPPGLLDFTSVPVTFKNSQRPDHRRADSINLLRKLARVSSMSPSPDLEPSRLRTSASQDGQPERRRRSSGATQEPPQAIDTNKDIKNFLAGLPSRPTSSDDRQAGSLKGVKIRDEQGEDDDVKRIPPGSDQPKSALADILAEAMNQPDGPFGEATINSLNDIVNPDLDRTDTLNIDEQRDGVKSERGANGSTIPQSERAHLESMDKTLRKASNSIQDVDRGLRRAENRFEMANSTQPAIESLPADSKPAQSHPVCDAVCEHCGSVRGSVWYALWVETRSLFYYFGGASWSSIRLTRLGFLFVVWLAWYLAESVACSYYCHPEYAVSMVGYGVDPDAPDFPFVVPTLLFRPFRWLWGPLIDSLAWSLGVLLQYLLDDRQAVDESFYMSPAS